MDGPAALDVAGAPDDTPRLLHQIYSVNTGNLHPIGLVILAL